MCLTVSAVKTRELMSKTVKTMTVYKRVLLNTDCSVGNVNHGKLCPPYIGNAEPYKPGWNLSDSKMKKVCLHDSHEINHGIHVYLTKKEAEFWVRGNETVIKMKVNLDDLLGAANNGTAVFKKAYISPKEYLRGQGGAN